MKRANYVYACLRSCIVCFLLLAFISSSLSLPGVYGNDTASYILAKKTKSGTHSESGLPAEEKEKETEGRTDGRAEGFALVELILLNELFCANIDATAFLQCCVSFSDRGLINPLYLVDCALLI